MKIRLSILLFLMFTLACGSAETPTESAQNTEPQADDTALAQATQPTLVDVTTQPPTTEPPTAVPPTTAPTPIPPTPTPAAIWTMEWQVDVGSVGSFYVFEDGSFVGYAKIDENTTRHVQFASDGSVTTTTDIVPPCSQRTHVLQDGVMVCTDLSNYDGGGMVRAVIISPDGTYSESEFMQHSATSLLEAVTNQGYVFTHTRVTLAPNHFGLRSLLDSSVGVEYDQPNSRDLVVSKYGMAWINPDNNRITLIGADGEQVFEGPIAGITYDMQFHQARVTPFGDLWLSYDAVDAIGNITGREIMRINNTSSNEESLIGKISADGRADNLLPSEYSSDFFTGRMTRFGDEVWCVCKHQLLILDRDLNVLEAIEFDMGRDGDPTYNNRIGFIGQDRNLYVYSNGALTKYSR